MKFARFSGRIGGFLVTLALAVLGAGWLHTTWAFSIIDQDLAGVEKSAAMDFDKDGTPDGAPVLVRLFRSETVPNLKHVYTFKIERFLSNHDADIKQILHEGDLFSVPTLVLNPFAYLVKRKPQSPQGDLYVVFLSQTPEKYMIVHSMKYAPVEEIAQADGTKRLVIENPWVKATGAALSGNARAQMAGPRTQIVRENLDQFVKRLAD